MRTLHVKLAALALSLGLFLAAATSAWIVSRPGVAFARPALSRARDLDASELYRVHCGGCHDREDLAPILNGPDQGAAILSLLDLLEDHGASDDREDRAIAGYLIGGFH